MEEFAEVLENKGKMALVRIIRQSACSKCDQDCAMAGDTNHESEEMSVEVSNPLGAEKGNLVKLEMGEVPVVYASLLVYLFPLLSMIAGYFISNWFAARFLYRTSEGIGIIGSLLFLFIAFLINRLLDTRLSMLDIFHPKIKEIVN